MDKTYTIEVTREDINKSDWHCHFCPEVLALKRKLTELKINFVGAKIKPSKTYKTIIATIYYPILEKDGTITIKNVEEKIKGLSKWSKEMDECFDHSSYTSFTIGGIYKNTNYNKRSKNTIETINYDIKLTDELYEAMQCDWLKEIRSEEQLCLAKEIFRYEDLQIEKELLHLKEHYRVDVDWLMCGEHARRDLSNFSTVKIIDYGGTLKDEKSGEVLIPTNCFRIEGLKKLVHKLYGKFWNNPNLIIYIAIRQIYMGEIEAGIAVVW